MAQASAIGERANLFLPFLLFLPVIILILKHFKISFSSKSPPLPPGPYRWPILGNIVQVGNKPHITLTKLAQTYGPLISVRLGTRLVVVGSSHAAAMEILKTKDRYLSGRYVPHMAIAKDAKDNNLSVGWVEECNNEWKHNRTTCRTELFSNKAIESEANMRAKKVMDMVRFIAAMEGKAVKIRNIASVTSMNMLSNILVSKDVVNFKQEYVDGRVMGIIRDIMDVAVAHNISDFFPILSRLDLQGLRKKSLELSRRFCSMWQAVLKERRERKSVDSSWKPQDFLDVLINDGSCDRQIDIMLLELLSAGTDTSSSTIEWTLAELIKNPEIMKKLKEELAREIQNDEIKESQLDQLRYLQACVKETLRLHPPGPLLLPHRAVETCQVMNYTVPKNSQVVVNYWAISRDPKYWEEPLVYKPERFLNSNLDFKGNDFEFFPFGSGRRICPGLPLAAKQVPLVIASLVHFFDWSLPGATNLDMSEKYSLAMMKEQPLLLIPKAKK